MKLCVKQIQICEGCLANVSHDSSCIRNKGEICNSLCTTCSEHHDLCTDCSEKGYESVDPSLRRCSRCMNKEMQCRNLLVIFNSSDCGSNYKKAMEIHSENIANGHIDDNLQHLRAFPDLVHVVKCLSCSMTNWFSFLKAIVSTLHF